MCNPKLITIAAIGAAAFTGGTSLGLIGTMGVAQGAAAGAAATSSITGLTAMQGLSLAASLASTGVSAAGAMSTAATQKAIAKNNAITADAQAKSTLAAGERDAQNVQRRGSMIEGAQRARMAANGLDISSGTPADLIDQTNFFTAQDVATTRTNARKQAWNAQVQSSGYQAQADGLSPMMTGATSLLGGAGQVADKWYTYTRGA